MRKLVLAVTIAVATIVVGCDSKETVDMSKVKSPQASTEIKSLNVSSKPKPPVKIVEGGKGTGLIVK